MTVFDIIYLTFSDNISQEQIDATSKGFLRLKEACLHKDTRTPYIKSITGGRDVLSSKSETTMVYILEFENVEDLQQYHEDPARKEIRKENVARVENAGGKVTAKGHFGFVAEKL